MPPRSSHPRRKQSRGRSRPKAFLSEWGEPSDDAEDFSVLGGNLSDCGVGSAERRRR